MSPPAELASRVTSPDLTARLSEFCRNLREQSRPTPLAVSLSAKLWRVEEQGVGGLKTGPHSPVNGFTCQTAGSEWDRGKGSSNCAEEEKCAFSGGFKVMCASGQKRRRRR